MEVLAGQVLAGDLFTAEAKSSQYRKHDCQICCIVSNRPPASETCSLFTGWIRPLSISRLEEPPIRVQAQCRDDPRDGVPRQDMPQALLKKRRRLALCLMNNLQMTAFLDKSGVACFSSMCETTKPCIEHSTTRESLRRSGSAESAS